MTDSEAQATANTRSIVLRIPSELHEAVKAKAAEEDRSMAQTVRRALKQYVGPPDLVVEIEADTAAWENARRGSGGTQPPAAASDLAESMASADEVFRSNPDTIQRLSEDIAGVHSMTQDQAAAAVERATRLYQGLVKGEPPPVVLDPEGEIVDAADELAAQIAGLRAGVAALKGTPEKCPHPVNRRIGKRCGACGAAVK